MDVRLLFSQYQQLWDFSLGIALKSRQNLMTAVNMSNLF